MADWSNPSRFQLEALHEALLFAYPRPADLNMLLTFNLGKSYFILAPVGESYKNALLDILIKAMGDGWLRELVLEARKDKPQSPETPEPRPQFRDDGRRDPKGAWPNP